MNHLTPEVATLLNELSLPELSQYLATRRAQRAILIGDEIKRLEEELTDLEWPSPTPSLERRVQRARVDSGNAKIREILQVRGITVEEAWEVGKYKNRSSALSSLFICGAKRGEDGKYRLEVTP